MGIKCLYARVVLWLIRPALDVRAKQQKVDLDLHRQVTLSVRESIFESRRRF